MQSSRTHTEAIECSVVFFVFPISLSKLRLNVLGRPCQYCQYCFDNPIQVHIPYQKSSQSFVFQLKCEVNSRISHNVLISKTIRYKSYNEICSGEPKKVNLGFNNDVDILKVENNTLMPYPPLGTHVYGESTEMSFLLVLQISS